MKKLFGKISAILDKSTLWIAVILPTVVIGIFFFLLTMSNIYTETYDIERFDRAKETIRSPITIENEVETDRKLRETALSVGDRYTIVDEITEEQISFIEEIFDGIENLTKPNDEQALEGEDTYDQEKLTDADKVYQLEEILSTEITDNIDEIVFMQLLRLDDEDRAEGKNIYIGAVENVLENGVRIENIQSAKEEVKAAIRYSTLNEDVKDVLNEFIEFTIIENSFFDVEKTLEARNRAVSTVEPVVIRSGDIIVREGQIITNEIYEDLKLVGVLDNDNILVPSLGLGILILFITGLIAYELNRLYLRNQLDKRKLLSIMIISIIVVTLMKVVSLFTDELNYLYLLVPITTGVLLLKLLIFERISMIFVFIFSILGSIIFNGEIPGTLNVEAGLYFLFFQFAGIIFLTNVRDRVTIVKTAFSMAIINVMTIVMFILLSFEKFELKSFLIHASFGVGAAILAAVLTIGILPFFETGLGILSDNKLLSLANPNQPLLKKILTEAPGTYHHSVMVANLSETACEAIGANGLLARVGSYYHDIGKTHKPHYFIENQVAMRNPHDFIAPKESAEIIISHVTEGVRMLEEHQLPKEIIDIALQHHGTSLVEYFYHQEKEKSGEADDKHFRYPGPKPQTKEAGIISICDATEAAVRSLQEPSPKKIEDIVTSIVHRKLIDGQLDETPLTLEELDIIRTTVCEALTGIFHSRIQYPTEEANN